MRLVAWDGPPLTAAVASMAVDAEQGWIELFAADGDRLLRARLLPHILNWVHDPDHADAVLFSPDDFCGAEDTDVRVACVHVGHDACALRLELLDPAALATRALEGWIEADGDDLSPARD